MGFFDEMDKKPIPTKRVQKKRAIKPFSLSPKEVEYLENIEYKMDSLEFVGSIPSKKNSRITDRKTGRTFPSKRYTDWHKLMKTQLMAQVIQYGSKLKIVHGLEITIYFPCNRKADLTNKAESIMDLLVDNKVLKDDNWKETGQILLIPEYRKNIGGCIIKPLKEIIEVEHDIDDTTCECCGRII